jgi:hypothetical protein
MPLNLSISQLVITTLSVLAIILGVVFIVHIQTMSEDITSTNLPAPYLNGTSQTNERIDITVTPPSSAEGTIFSITANIWPPKNSQDLQLTIEKDNNEIPLTLFDDGQHQDGISNDGIYGALFNSQNLDLGVYTIKGEDESLADFTLYDPVCEPIIGTPSDNKIKILILPSGYTNTDIFKQRALDLILGENSVSQIEPFKSNFDQFTFYISEPRQNLNCKIGCNDVSTMVCCDDSVVIDAASQCQYDGLIVLINSDADCGTASFYTKLCANSEQAGLILTHELGHSFGNLADEYVYSENFDDYSLPDDYIITMPNCDAAGCPKWANTTADCFQGCTSQNLYRSSPNSIMRYVAFGKFNEVSQARIQKIIIDYTDSFIAQNRQKSFQTNLNYNEGEISLSPVTTRPARAGRISTEGYFTASLLDGNQNKIYSTPIPLPLFEYPALEISEKPIFLSSAIIPISLPFLSESNTLEISHNGKILAAASLAAFSDFCGNSICELSENHVSCAKDCVLESDNFCEPESCDPDCPNYESCSQSGTKEYLWSILLILAAITTLAFIIFRKRSNRP